MDMVEVEEVDLSGAQVTVLGIAQKRNRRLSFAEGSRSPRHRR